MDPKKKEKLRKLANEILACLDEDYSEGDEKVETASVVPEDGDDDDVAGKSFRMKMAKYK